MKNPLIKILFLFQLIFVFSCSRPSETTLNPAPIEPKASFAIIQEQIFTPTCATSGCHLSSADASYLQHGLVLASSSLSYANLIDKQPKNLNALNQKLLLVSKSNLNSSFLYHKLNWDNAHHAGIDYGASMPLGGKPLTIGQLEFVKRWIEAGAPEKGSVVDEAVLSNSTPHYIPDANFVPLETPQKEGKTGYQLSIPKFPIQANFERELFVRLPLGNTQPVYINRIKLKSRSNSHHLVLYDFKNKLLAPALNEIRDLRNSDNSLNVLTYLQLANHVFLGGGTDPNSDYTFPEGTALEMPVQASIDVNPHYFNRTTEIAYGENYVNLYSIPAAEVKNIVKMIDFNNTNFGLPANKTTVITTDFTFGKKVAIVALTSHFHEWGKKFQIKIKGGARDGEVIYENTDWQHPKVINFTKPIELAANEGLSSVVTYENNTNHLITFGFTSQDEMNIIFGYYYELK